MITDGSAACVEHLALDEEFFVFGFDYVVEYLMLRFNSVEECVEVLKFSAAWLAADMRVLVSAENELKYDVNWNYF